MNNFEVVDFVGNSTEPKSVKRISDNKVFSLGDKVTNGTKMKGKIEKFEFSFKTSEVFIYTDWSGIGMSLESIYKPEDLPSRFQLSDKVTIDFGTCGKIENCIIIKVHFTNSKVLYDVEFYGKTIGEININQGKPENFTTRLYNIDSDFVK